MLIMEFIAQWNSNKFKRYKSRTTSVTNRPTKGRSEGRGRFKKCSASQEREITKIYMKLDNWKNYNPHTRLVIILDLGLLTLLTTEW